jgi:hypothetical protein
MYSGQNVLKKNRRTYMSISDLWHSPLIDTAVTGLKNPPRVDLQDSASSGKVKSVESGPLVRVIEGASNASFAEKNSFLDREGDSIEIVEHNSRIEAQDIAQQPAGSKANVSSNKPIAVVASAAETVGTHDALARLDQNGDGRIDQVEVKKGVRADESTSTFAALSQYQKSLEIQYKLSDSEDLDANKLFNGDEIKVEKLFDDENLEKDLYQEEFEEQPKKKQTETVVIDIAS